MMLYKAVQTKIRFFSTITNQVSSSSSSSLISHYFSLIISSPNPTHLRHLHARLLRTSLYDNVVLTSKLISMYSLHNSLPYSLSLFFHMPNANVFSWNIIIGEFYRSKKPKKALNLFLLMWRECRNRPDDFTFPVVLRAISDSGYVCFGDSVHGLCLQLGFGGNLFVGSGLVFMYLRFGRIEGARMVFDKMRVRDSVLWTSLLSGYAQRGMGLLGLGVYREMVDSGVEVDWVVMISLVLICGQLGLLKHGKSVHGWCVRNFSCMELNLENAVIDMYLKFAMLGYARTVFDHMAVRDVVSWSSLILSYGLSGDACVALELFDRMLVSGVKPNDVTFLGVLSACAHGGLVDRASTFFKMMEDYGVLSELKHCACMVDCLARAGHLEEAERFTEEMRIEPDAEVLVALLGGCRVYNNVEVGERVAMRLIRMEPEKAGYYVLLSNIYAAAGKFDKAEMIRDLMKRKNISKVPGSSLIESNCDFPYPSPELV